MTILQYFDFAFRSLPYWTSSPCGRNTRTSDMTSSFQIDPPEATLRVINGWNYHRHTCKTNNSHFGILIIIGLYVLASLVKEEIRILSFAS